MKRSGSDETLRCSFCHKSQDAVGKLISSPSDYPRAYICDECIAVCNSILEDDRNEPAAGLPNKLPKPLEIKDVKSICGCTSSLVSDKVVPPGGQSSLKIQFDAGYERIAGLRVTREVKVSTNDPARPEISFHIAAYIRPQ